VRNEAIGGDGRQFTEVHHDWPLRLPRAVVKPPTRTRRGIGRRRGILARSLACPLRGMAIALIVRQRPPASRPTVILRECLRPALARVRPSPKRECCVISSVVVSYQVRPEAIAEHVRLIEAVFAQLHAEQPDNVEYKVVRLDDGVSFVHISSADTPDGSNPLPELAAFKEFGRDSAARVATPPVPTAADIIGSYYPAVPVTDR
jgi:hypothetical protein